MYSVKRLPAFERSLKDILKKFPKSANRINAVIDALGENPIRGDLYPGFAEQNVRKIRISLKEYNIGESKGLRLIFLVLIHEESIIPLHVYPKTGFKAEYKIRDIINSKLKEISESL